MDAATLLRLARTPSRHSMRRLVVPLNLGGNVGGKDRLQPLTRAATNDPGVSRGYRASKAGGELCGSQGKAIVPSHGWILPRKNKNAMRKIKACNVIRNAYSLRMSNTFQNISTATRNKIAEEVGNFILVSFSTFEAHGVNRTRYTVRKPRGKKLIHLIGFENGTIQAV